MGEVWLATDLRLRRTVALKRGKPGVRIAHEGVGGAKLMHPNVITVFDVIKDDTGQEWLVMEYLPSRNLKTLRDEDGPLQPRAVAAIGAQIASALAHLHGKGMVHRDISPANVLVAADGTAKLTDFGIATWQSETYTADPTTGGGTPGFQAPEVRRGNRVTQAADIYSLGATLAAAVEGHPSAEAAPGAPLAALLDSLTDSYPQRRPTAEQAHHQLAHLATPAPRRVWWLAATAAAVVVILVLYLLLASPFRRSPNAIATPGPPDLASTTPVARSILGDPRTADPCALTYANALSAYGQVETSTDYGGFNRCDALVTLTVNPQDFVDVIVQFAIHQQDPGVPVQRVGDIGLQRPPADATSCGRTLVLPHDYQVTIDAEEHGQAQVDLCGMADAVTSGALVTLNAGQIPRRTLPAASLARRDACGLLDDATVTAAVGAGLARQAQFGNWECDWSDADDTRLVQVVFDQNKLGVGETADGTPIRLAGYSGRVLPPDDEDTDCDVDLVYRTYTDTQGDRTADVVEVKVDGDQPAAQRCALAQHLARTVAQRLAH